MSFDIRELYQEMILDHNRNPRNFRVIDPCTHHAEGYNPLCGDQIEVFVNIEDGVIKDVSFQGDGCAISTASSSMMTDAVRGKTVEDADALFTLFHDAVMLDGEDSEGLGKLRVLTGVREYPARVKCATLAWHAMQAAIHEKDEVAKTE